MARVPLHPSQKELLSFADGELKKGQAARIEQHLASCWQCRALLAETEDVIGEFVALRRKMFDQQKHSSGFTPEHASRALLRARLSEMPAPAPRWRRIGLALRPLTLVRLPLWTAGSLVALLGILLLVYPVVAPNLSAMEVIANTKASEQRIAPGTVSHQRIRIQRKKAAASSTVDYDLWRNGVRNRMILTVAGSDSDDRLRALYLARGADWDNPLSAASFARLRESLGGAHDEIRGRAQITVVSTPAGGYTGELRRLEFTVRRSDWHAVSQRIQTRDADYVLTEVADEVVARDKVSPSIFGEPAPPAAPASRLSRREAPIPVVPPAGPSSEQLDSAEIELREGLHQTWADVEEVPEIRREGSRIHLRLFAETSQRKQEIMAALTDVPYLVPEVTDAQSEGHDSEAKPGPPAPAAPQAATYSTAPPLAKALRDYSGGLEPANNYLNAVRDAYLQILVDAAALKRLAERYPDAEWNRLTAESQQRLNRIAADHVAAIRTNLRNYLKLLSPVLDEMSREQRIDAGIAAEAPDAGCAPWRTAAEPLVAEIGRLQTALRRLFIEERTEQPVVLSAAELLEQSLQSRSRLRHSQLCQP